MKARIPSVTFVITSYPTGVGTPTPVFLASERPHKIQVKCVRPTVGENLVHYLGNVLSTHTIKMSTSKMLFNSTISTKNGCFADFDHKNFYLGTSIQTLEYMCIHISIIPDSIIAQYKLFDLVQNCYVLVEIMKGMNGLPQTGILYYEQLITHIARDGFTSCLWKDATRDITFCLMVDDFGVTCTDKVDATHLFNVIRELYEVTTDWTGLLYIGITLDWDYDTKTVDISIPSYI
jgi:hypothetical protein